jgi:exodeoxyribonuclease-3
VEDALFPKVPFMELGYGVHHHGGKALAGVATLTKASPQAVYRGFRDGPPDAHPRVLHVVVDGVRIYNVYAPNGTELGSKAFAYKLSWFRRLRAELDAHCKPSDPVVIVGDFNVAPDDRDVWDAAAFAGRLLFTDEEKHALSELVAFGLRDCFRQLHAEPGQYTWFDYRTGGFARNEGMRIDHVYATGPMADRCVEVVHDHVPRSWDVPSDHVPVTARFA